jgi:hypothetical protein
MIAQRWAAPNGRWSVVLSISTVYRSRHPGWTRFTTHILAGATNRASGPLLSPDTDFELARATEEMKVVL